MSEEYSQEQNESLRVFVERFPPLFKMGDSVVVEDYDLNNSPEFTTSRAEEGRFSSSHIIGTVVRYSVIPIKADDCFAFLPFSYTYDVLVKAALLVNINEERKKITNVRSREEQMHKLKRK